MRRTPSLVPLAAFAFIAAVAFGSGRARAIEPPTLEDILKPSQHDLVTMSPSGKYVAATVRKPVNNENRMLLVVIDRQTNKPVRILDPEEKSEISQVSWANDERLFVRNAWGGDMVEQYYIDPRIIAVNVDGTRRRVIYDAIIDTLVDDDDHVLVAVCARRTAQRGCWSYVEKVDNDSSRKRGERQFEEGPEPGVEYIVDNAGQVRFASIDDDENIQRIWLRKGKVWETFHDSKDSKRKLWPIGTSRDDGVMFFQVERETGPDVIERYDFATGERKVVMSDPELDPAFIVWSADRRQPIGAAYGPGVPRARFWNADDPDAKLLRGMEKAFPEDAVAFLSGSKDGQHIVVEVWSDRDPASYYILDRATKKMDLVARRSPWLNPESLARSEPITFTARDGLVLHGYLTLPLAKTATPPPLIVMPHGGPFGVHDTWSYDEEVQLLAARGYAVLRVNYRGSSGRGVDFLRSGYRQWGYKIMDDIVDGTRWAAAGGRIDPRRICIWGTSFGGYASLMGAVRAPDLYRCAISTAGATNLNITRKWGDTHRSRSGKQYLDEAVGDDQVKLFDQSPLKYVSTLDTPILLVHGNHDQRVSFEHARAMVAAMEKAGKPMETFFFGDETHGIYGEENRKLYYERVLAFLKKHLGN